MTQVSPKTVYHNLRWLDTVSAAMSALYRQQAQDVLGDLSIHVTWRQAIANRLNQANHQLAMQTTGKEDSY